MSESTIPSPVPSASRVPLPEIVPRKLRLLKRALHFYVAADGFATSCTALALLFWIDLGLDRFFQPGRSPRLLLLLVLLGMVGLVLWVRIFRRLFATLRDDQLAMVLERQVPALNETLLTVIDLRDRRDAEIHPRLWEATLERAAASLRSVSVHAMFKYRRLVVRSLLAVLMLGLVAGFCVAFPETAGTWVSRNLFLSGREWPRESRILVEGFDGHGRAQVARGDAFTFLVRADTSMPLVPETVKIDIGSQTTGRRTLVLDQFRLDTVGTTEYRTFAYTFPELLEPVDLSVGAADTRLDGFRIDVVPPPVLAESRLTVSYPEYMQRSSDPPIRPTGRLLVPEGAGIVLDATASKPLRRLSVARDGGTPTTVFEASESEIQERFAFTLTDLRADTYLEFTLEDHDGLKNRHPIRFEFAIAEDTLPVVAAALVGIGNAVTPIAVLPTEGTVSDDHGIDRVFYDYTVVRGTLPPDTQAATPAGTPPASTGPPNGQEGATIPTDAAGTVPIAENVNRTHFPISRDFSVHELNLNPGDRLTLSIAATDKYTLPGADTANRSGFGDRWSLDIVSADQLKTLLEVKEITLRQRFEVLIEEVKRTREIAEAFPLDPVAPVEPTDSETAPSESPAEPLAERDRQLAELQRIQQERIAKEQADTGAYDVARTLRDVQKETFEIGTIAQAFQDIRLEMANNRILTPETRQRLDEGIVAPIRSLLEREFVDLDNESATLDRLLQEYATTPRTQIVEHRAEVLARYDRVLERMAAIRDSMLTMESYAEAIELLRTIIRQQEQIREETQKEKKSQLRELLEQRSF